MKRSSIVGLICIALVAALNRPLKLTVHSMAFCLGRLRYKSSSR